MWKTSYNSPLYQISSDRRKHFIAFAPTDSRSSFQRQILAFVSYRGSGPGGFCPLLGVSTCSWANGIWRCCCCCCCCCHVVGSCTARALSLCMTTIMLLLI